MKEKNKIILELQNSIGIALIDLLNNNYEIVKGIGEEAAAGYALAFQDVYLLLVGRDIQEDIKEIKK